MVGAGGRADELAGVLSKELQQGTGVLFLQRFAGNDHGAGVHLRRGEAGVSVTGVDEVHHLVGIDVGAVEVRREHDGRTVEHFTISHSELGRKGRALPPQGELGEHHVGSGGTDIDAHTGEGEHLDALHVHAFANGHGVVKVLFAVVLVVIVKPHSVSLVIYCTYRVVACLESHKPTHSQPLV